MVSKQTFVSDPNSKLDFGKGTLELFMPIQTTVSLKL